jgi:sugar lactone lactonase YvrE
MAGILFLYNRSVTQSAIQVPYETEFKRFDIPNASTLGFSFPAPWKLLNLAFSPGVGLFFHSPWLLAIFPAAVVAFRTRPGRRRLLLGALAAAVVMVLTIASHAYWVGGAIAGPRYIAASLPFLLFPIAGLTDRVKGRWRTAMTTALIATSVLSIVVFFLILVVTPYINTSPEHLSQNPLGSFVWPLLTAGRMMFTVANYCGAGVWLSFALFLLLLTLVLGGFALPAVCAVNARTRWRFLGSGALGLVLVPFWAGIGSQATVETRRHVPRLMRLMNLDTQFRGSGEILFMLRPTAIRPRRFHHDVARIDPSLESVLGRDPSLYEVATNFKLLQGAVWSPDGFLFLSDARKPVLYKYDPAAGVSINRSYHGYRSSDAGQLESPGSSGLAFDPSGRLTIAEYGGGRRVVRLEQDGRVTVLADRFEGKRLNSPSSLAYRSDGLLYFTDPPFGLGRAGGDAGQELDFGGVFRLAGGKLELMDRKVGAPAGIAFSPDERHLYVAEWSPRRKLLIRFDVDSEGNLSNGRAMAVFPGSGIKLPTQGLLVDRKGNLFVTVGSNIGIVSRHGKHLGVIRTEAPVMGLAWGDPDGKALYMTAGRLLLKMRVRTGGGRR